MVKEQSSPKKSGDFLVALLNNKKDFSILQEQLWYRIPVKNAPRRWPPKWIAFYQTKVFDSEAYSVRYFGEVKEIKVATRIELFPNEPLNPKSSREYYQICLEKLEERPDPIPSYRPRRLLFIPTTYYKFNQAEQINDLFDDSPLEDRLWEEFKKLIIGAERQWALTIGKHHYRLDFALFCKNGFINVETDGDRWHALKRRIPRDNNRNNDLASIGWQVMRFGGDQILNHMDDECMNKILKTINKLGGLSNDGLVPRTFYSSPQGFGQQLTLFDSGAIYNLEARD